MNDSTEHPLHEALLHDALHAHVRETGDEAAAPYLIGLADGALRVARRRQRMARAGVGVVVAAVVATAGVAVADGATRHVHLVQPAAGGTGRTEKAARLSLLPVTSVTLHACTRGSGGYTLRENTPPTTMCVHVDPAKGMTDIRATSAKADNSGPSGLWEVDLTLGPADRTRLAALTATAAAATSPRNEVAVVIDGKLFSAPSVSATLTGGRFSLAGNLTSASAHDLALRLGTGK
ncbi:hypothetical protein ACEZDB_32940 [Streptacidiphilus sp. N1-3]|uniref:SecDF P1 head subdomain domain-containing protein n=1 Tax=Streptacidiphilus alkalitolerans TaxID=3342712 RepID=A0ABV6XB64_9ACTN